MGSPPVSFLIDYDGTISCVDVLDELLRLFLTDAEVAAEADEKDRAYAEGRVGSRELMAWDLSVLPPDPALLRDTAAAQPHDLSFPAFVAAAHARGAAIEVVSDGLGFYVEPALRALGVAGLPIASNRALLDGAEGPAMEFPFGHPACFVCGTCKRERVRGHQAAGRFVVFIGDGTSDRFAAAHADVVFAKDSLARMCDREGWPYRAWNDFSEIQAWMEEAFDSGELPGPGSELPERVGRPPDARGFICGPEAWGPDRTTPPSMPSPTLD